MKKLIAAIILILGMGWGMEHASAAQANISGCGSIWPWSLRNTVQIDYEGIKPSGSYFIRQVGGNLLQVEPYALWSTGPGKYRARINKPKGDQPAVAILTATRIVKAECVT